MPFCRGPSLRDRCRAEDGRHCGQEETPGTDPGSGHGNRGAEVRGWEATDVHFPCTGTSGLTESHTMFTPYCIPLSVPACLLAIASYNYICSIIMNITLPHNKRWSWHISLYIVVVYQINNQCLVVHQGWWFLKIFKKWSQSHHWVMKQRATVVRGIIHVYTCTCGCQNEVLSCHLSEKRRERGQGSGFRGQR